MAAPSSTCRLLLRALNHPKPDEVVPSNEPSFRSCVSWLEDSKIRALPMGDRGPLRAMADSNWGAALSQYLAELGCPHTPNASNHPQILEWLLSHAVGLEYQDQAARYNTAAAEAATRNAAAEAQAAEPPAKPAKRQQAAGPPFPDVESPAFREALETLAAQLNIPRPTGGSTASLVKAVAGAVRRHLSPAALKQIQQPATGKRTGSGEPTPVPGDLSGFPLGFSLGDPVLDKAATVLRLIYIVDMKELQSEIDRILVETQEYTADPRTDSSLGKVGR